MTDDVARLQAQLNALTEELRSAQRAIRTLESRGAWRPNAFALFTVFIMVTGVVGFRTVHASPANPPTTMKAPFEVVDNAGKAIFRVQEIEPGLARGAYIYTASGKEVVDLQATTQFGGGGRLRVNSEGDIESFVAMAATTDNSVLATYKSGKRTVLIGTDPSNAGIVKVFRSDGEKAAATLKRLGEGGALRVFGSGEKPAATIESDAGDGKLSINDKGGQEVAGVYGTDNGGVVKVMKSGAADTYASMSSINAGLGMAIRKAGTRLVFAGAGGEGDKGSVYVYGKNGDMPVAGITSYGGGKGLVAVFNQATAIAMLAESDKHPGGGDITASDPAGNGIFSAGFTGAGGDACVTRKNGLWCMGTNLPLQMH